MISLERAGKIISGDFSLEDVHEKLVEDVQFFIKVFLRKIQSLDESEIIGTVRKIFKEHNYTETELLRDVAHIKEVHEVDGDDVKFDAAFDFFADVLDKEPCSIENCPYIQRHYRNGNTLPNELKQIPSTESDTVTDDVLMDIMALIHCYFLHSFDTDRLTKSERKRVELQLSDDMESNEKSIKRKELIDDILSAKKERLRKRVRSKTRFQAMLEALCDSELGLSLPPPLCHEITEYGQYTMDSVLLNDEEQGYLMEMIQSQRQTEYFKHGDWNLLCRHSRDGAQYDRAWNLFHKKCDGRKDTLCLMEVKETGLTSELQKLL